MSTYSPPKITAVLPWFGSKRALAADIIAELGPHSQYFEPACGGLAVVIAKRPCQKETVNDLHGDLVNLARVIRVESTSEQLYGRLDRAVISDGILIDARAVLEDHDLAETIADENDQFPGAVTPAMIERAYWYFIASWMARNGVSGTERLDYQLAVRWTKSGGSPTTRFRNATDSLPAWHRRLQNVVILRRDLFAIVPQFEDAAGTAIYVDPPYPKETRDGWRNSGSENRYVHEFNHEGNPLFDVADDHERLAAILRTFKKARVVVSTYDCPRYRNLYRGWTFVDKTMQKALVNSGRRGTQLTSAPEFLILNGPSYAPEHPR